ncbi:MAG: FAD-binding oxidoreductase [Sandaracinaceae bacterium]|nr:FAD-binding oxidoreductase [Sandaracinaceae bacterium]
MVQRRQFLRWLGSAAVGVGCSGRAAPPAPSEPEPPADPDVDVAPEVDPAPEPTAPTRPATDADWARLAEQLDGRLVRPDAPDYATARLLFDPRFDDLRPAGIAYCASESDVQRSIAFARDHGLPFAARCGGHSYGGYSSGAGLVCDVSPLSTVRVDAAGGAAVLGAGARLIDIYAGLAARGLALPGGSCPSVGIAGLTLGGGQGVLSRKLGLTCDALSSLRIVTADATIHACDAGRDDDLFWASRGGGGGNFGVATSFTFRADPVAELTRFALPWPWAAAADVIAAWQSWGPDAPDELWSKCEIGARGGAASIAVHGVYVGPPSALAPSLDALVRLVGSAPRRRSVEAAPLLESMLALGGCARRTLEECHLPPEGTLGRGIHLSRSDVFDAPLPPAGITALLEAMDRGGLEEGSGRIGLDAVGGAVNRVPADATAFVHRGARFIAQYATFWGRRATPAVVEASTRWLDRLYAAARPHASGFAYQNYIDPRLSDWAHAYYGANLPRLRAIKARHDPDGLFRFAQSIAP